jgi:hypothetical protein
MRFCYAIKTDEVFDTHKGPISCANDFIEIVVALTGRHRVLYRMRNDRNLDATLRIAISTFSA